MGEKSLAGLRQNKGRMKSTSTRFGGVKAIRRVHYNPSCNIFACMCPNWSEVEAIDNPDRFEQAFFTHDISMIRRHEMFIFFGVLKAFISKYLL